MSLTQIINECPNQNLIIKVRNASVSRIEREIVHTEDIEKQSPTADNSGRSVSHGKPIGEDRPLPSKRRDGHGKSETLSRNTEAG